MYELCTIFVAGILLSIGWRVGTTIFEGIRDFILDAPDGIREIKRYQKRKQYRKDHHLYYDMRKRS